MNARTSRIIKRNYKNKQKPHKHHQNQPNTVISFLAGMQGKFLAGMQGKSSSWGSSALCPEGKERLIFMNGCEQHQNLCSENDDKDNSAVYQENLVSRQTSVLYLLYLVGF